MRHFHPDGTAIDLFQLLADLAQRQQAAVHATEPPAIEHGIQVGFAQPRVLQFRCGTAKVGVQLQRIHSRGAIAPQAIQLDEPHDRPLAGGAGTGLWSSSTVAARNRAAIRQTGRKRAPRLNTLKQLAPMRGYIFGVGPPRRIQLEHVWGIARKQR